MTDSKELYKTLSTDFKAEKNYYFSELGEGMMQGRERNSRRVFLINKNEREAWELVEATGAFEKWDAVAVEICMVLDLPKRAQRNAISTMANYYFGVNPFRDGVAYVQWTLQPDGRYYADSDGFGMTDDDEVNVYAFIDKKAHILVPFQPMNKELRERYRKQAIEIANNITEKPYVCLNPQYTIPISENTNLEAHRDLLRKLVLGMMLQYGAMAINPEQEPEYGGKIGILTAINPNEDENLQFMLLGIPVEGQDDTYEIHGITSFVRKGEEPIGCRTPFGVMTATEICDAMNLEGNVDILLDDFIESAKMIYSGELPRIKFTETTMSSINTDTIIQL